MNSMGQEMFSKVAKIAGYREALRICETSVDRDGVYLQDFINEFEEMEKAYHYAQRYIGLYTPAGPGEKPGPKARVLANHKLAFKTIFNLHDCGVQGVGYNGRELKYVLLPPGVLWFNEECRQNYRKTYGITQEFAWREDPWLLLKVGEKMTGSIGRVKAKTMADVQARLFIPLEAKHVNDNGAL
jgi:hypothetical protein